MLRHNNIQAKMMQLVDNNCIDKAVTEYQPTLVIIEAFWVVPSKLDILQKLHPRVNWAVRNHSEMAFLANEGMSMDWIYGYLSRGVEIMNNSPRAVDDVKTIAHAYGAGLEQLVSYAPNFYPIEPSTSKSATPWVANDTVKIGCFGAIRPLKNHLTQAVAAIKFAGKVGRKLEFHVNSSRVEGYGAPIVKNLREMFSHTRRAVLVEHPWIPRLASWGAEDETQFTFLDLMRTMNYSLQCSFSETFNIVSADAIWMRVPVITSAQVPFLSHQFHADPNDSESIVGRLMMANNQRPGDHLDWLEKQSHELKTYCKITEQHWIHRFG
jgi:hypothetical protein